MPNTLLLASGENGNQGPLNVGLRQRNANMALNQYLTFDTYCMIFEAFPAFDLSQGMAATMNPEPSLSAGGGFASDKFMILNIFCLYKIDI